LSRGKEYERPGPNEISDKVHGEGVLWSSRAHDPVPGSEVVKKKRGGGPEKTARKVAPSGTVRRKNSALGGTQRRWGRRAGQKELPSGAENNKHLGTGPMEVWCQQKGGKTSLTL